MPPADIQKVVTTRTVVLTALAMAAFAGNSIFCRLALARTAIDPATFTLVRMVSGAAMLALLCVSTRRKLAGDWRMAAALLGYAVLFSYAYVALTAATGALLLFGAVQATMITRGIGAGERLAPLQWVGFGVAVVALASLLAPGVAAPEPWHALLMIGSGIAWGFYSLLGRGQRDPLATTAGNFARGALLALPLLLMPNLNWDSSGLVWAIMSGAVASGIGYAIWYAALPTLTATQAATVQLSVPVIAALSGVALLGEALSVRLALTSAIVLIGIALVIRKPAGR